MALLQKYWHQTLKTFKNQQNISDKCGLDDQFSCDLFPLFSILCLTFLPHSNEREGIPANLLQLLDVCVEIPQQGVIRSLNVHVSAALLIWEYTRQHFTSGSSEVNSKHN